MPQYILRHSESDYNTDVFESEQVHEKDYPECTLPFKDLQIRANGNVPLCHVTGSTIVPGKKRINGNVRNTSLGDLWNGEELNKIRHAHRTRKKEDMEVCRGCRGA